MSDHAALPDADTLERASNLIVFDVKGEKVKFGSIFEKEKTIIVFVRHFFCGAYVERLGAIPKEALERAETKIVIVGCGEWNPIESYAETAQFDGPIFADPSRELYRTLGMTTETLATTPAGQQRRSYLTSGTFSNAMQSIWRGPLKHPSLIGKQGNISQLGGDFIFGPGSKCSLASRMQHTEDHLEISDLIKAAGVNL